MSEEFPALRPNRYRDTWCGQVLPDRVDAEVRVAGWVHRRRDHGGLVFIDLRDRTGLVQLVLNPDELGEAFKLGHELRSEDVLSAKGSVVKRSPETVNEDLPTGEVEIRVTDAELISDADTPPFEIESFSGEVSEETRLRYRYLDLRRDRMREAIELRHRVAAAMREFLSGEGFLEIETPVLTRSTPEGARDFLVPSRLQRGNFYALPQSPQLFKQLLMIGGFERYFQIARCFRDEDLRADRQPDFTQLDIEMSFVDTDDVIDLNERLLAHVLPVCGVDVELPMKRLPYDEAIDRYGSDKPDLRFGLELRNLTEVFRGSEFNAFRAAIEGGALVRGLNAGKREMSRSDLDGLVGEATELGAKGLVWGVVEADGWRSPVAKFLSVDEIEAANEDLGASEGDVVLLVADQPLVSAEVLGELRRRLGDRLGLIDPEANELVWIVDWPLLRWAHDEDRWDPHNHPFTSPDGPFDPADPGRRQGEGLRRRLERMGNWWGLDPYQRPKGAARGVRGDRNRRATGRGPLRLPARRAALRGAPARRHRIWPGPDGGAGARQRLDPRRDRFSQDSVGRRPDDRRARARRRAPAPRSRDLNQRRGRKGLDGNGRAASPRRRRSVRVDGCARAAAQRARHGRA